MIMQEVAARNVGPFTGSQERRRADVPSRPDSDPANDPANDPEDDLDRGVYGITVAAELVGLEAQSLRLYESRGLLTPDRTSGGTRRYSANDLARLRRIAELMATGVNLTGVGMLLDLQDENTRLRREIDARPDGQSRSRAAARQSGA
jgi:DNA-binding transcriptional MerR regulator